MIGSDGSYEIIKRKDAYPTPLTEVYAPPQKQTSAAIRRGNATNRLRADCVGNTFALYINGQLVAVAEDPDAEFASGDVGLTMENLTSTLNEALFDHFVVVAPRAALPAPTRVPSGTVLLQEDFSDPARSNLPEGVQDDDSVLEYTSGGYRIFIPRSDQSRLVSLPGYIADQRVEVDITKLGGPDESAFGVYCHYGADGQGYEFLIGADGYYAISKLMAGGDEFVLLVGGGESRSNAIRRGDATNRLRAECSDDTLTLFVNGEQVAEARDGEFQLGGFAFIAIAFEDTSGGIDVLFDNLVVSKP